MMLVACRAAPITLAILLWRPAWPRRSQLECLPVCRRTGRLCYALAFGAHTFVCPA